MDKETATSVIAKWLTPRVRFWVACRKGTDEESLWAPMPFCRTCDRAAFCEDECVACKTEKARDPKAFAAKHDLCDHCFAYMGASGCDNGCDDDYRSPSGPCRMCGSEIEGNDWACYGYCSRYCAVTLQNESDRYGRYGRDW
jgi:hypothetical protein